MKPLMTGRMAQAAAKYGEMTPAATACCNTCRTCATTNVLTLVMAGAVAAGTGITRLWARFARHPDF